jgi:predicted type IV restriction endonuclease
VRIPKKKHTAMSQVETSNAIADSISTQYASLMDSLIEACNRLEETNAALAAERDIAIGERDRAIAGVIGDVDFRSYCECCSKMWHREYVTWFQRPFQNRVGASCNSACGVCFEQVPIDQEPL